MSIKVTPSKRNERTEIQVKTLKTNENAVNSYWWLTKDKDQMGREVLETASFLKTRQQYRYRQASIHARLYGNMPLANFAGSNLTKLSSTNNLPVDRPTFNVIQSCVDTLVSRISQSRPRPVFLTDGGDYKARTLSKQMNNFISGEFYQLKANQMAEQMLRDATILGTGCCKILETGDKKVGMERVLLTELLVDANDAFYGNPRTLYQLKLIDRSIVSHLFPKERSKIAQAEQAYPDNSGDSSQTMSDQIMLVESWHLPSGPGAGDGKHVISCSSGLILEEDYDKKDFPFVFLHYSPRLVGFWSQGLSEQLTGTQIEINKLLVTISQSISLVGVPRVFVEDGSKVVKAHLNDKVGAIVTYRGTKPIYEVAPCVPQELYAQLQRLIDYAYQQSGISALAATSQKPAGLNSGEAIRNYDDLQSDRFTVLNKRFDNLFIDLAYKVIDCAKDIAIRDGKYSTVYPNKDGTKEICLPEAKLLDNPFVIQCFDSNALPKDPAGRKQSIVDDMQAGILTLEEGRRLLNYSDLEQDDKLAMAAEERILKILDDIVESGKYVPPDSMINIMLAKTKVVQYYNLYAAYNLTEERLQMLRDWQEQLSMLEQAAMPPMPQAAPGDPMANPMAPPTSDMLPVA